MFAAFKFLLDRLKDANAVHTGWQWLPPALGIVITMIAGWYTFVVARLEELPIAVGMACVLTAIAMTLNASVLLAYVVGRQRQKARFRHFKCDFQTLQRLCLLLAEVKDDCLNYNPYDERMAARQIELESSKAVFQDSGLKQEFILFAHGVQLLVTNKQLQSLGKERQVEVISYSETQISENYPKLKAALDHDYEKARS
ncbi:hypothetical protein TA3x_000396 [Tundrisphaera sp. TA3]|uniref:hypothetical protein n=1 Tax=Tundrisphaera sp. TA3 TaxID=3435775 RepID=UPI003EB6C95F